MWKKNNITLEQTNSVRFLGVDAVNHANSGHPGVCLGAAPMITELFANHLNVFPKESKWINRDRFVMGAGHGSALLYSILHHMQYDVTIDDLKKFRQLNSRTPGHPEFGHTDGVDATSGPLGQGFCQAVGMALAEKALAAEVNTKDHKIIDHYTYLLTSDGELQEGVSYESMSFAGHYGLNKLIVLFDSNDYQLDGAVSDSFSEDLEARCKALKWEYLSVRDGEDREKISKAISVAKASSRPTLIEIKTILGAGTTLTNSSATHGAPIGEDERDKAAKHFGHKQTPFIVSPEVKKAFNSVVSKKKSEYEKWKLLLTKYKKATPRKYTKFNKLTTRIPKVNLSDAFDVKLGKKEATRNYSPEIIEYISKKFQTFIGGSADLNKSTKVMGYGGNFIDLPTNKNINFGVREFAMAGIANGMSLHGGIKPFVSGFLIFTDYCKAAIRLSALQNLPVIYIFTHDSVAVGEDGPTHQPIEQVSSLRATPNLNVVRPADQQEAIWSYQQAFNETSRPTMIVMSRQVLENVSKVSFPQFKKGAYIIKDSAIQKPKLTVVATGSEVSTVIEAVKKMEKERVIRVVSMPSMDNFDLQTDLYKKSIIPRKDKTIFIEASDGSSGYKYADYVHGIFNSFGTSAPGDKALAKFKMDSQSIKRIITKTLMITERKK